MKMAANKASMIAVCVLSASLGACLPYDHKFLCEENADYGKCSSVQGAYDHAVSGDETEPSHASHSEQSAAASGAATEEEPSAKVAVSRATPKQLYRDSQYRAMAGMIDGPVAPVVAPPKVIRTLVLAYQDQATGTMYMPRFVYSIVEGSRFVMGTEGADVPGMPMLYPNGGGPTVSRGGR